MRPYADLRPNCPPNPTNAITPTEQSCVFESQPTVLLALLWVHQTHQYIWRIWQPLQPWFWFHLDFHTVIWLISMDLPTESPAEWMTIVGCADGQISPHLMGHQANSGPAGQFCSTSSLFLFLGWLEGEAQQVRIQTEKFVNVWESGSLWCIAV